MYTYVYPTFGELARKVRTKTIPFASTMLDLFCRALCGQPLILPVEGPIPSERPHPSPTLARDIRSSVRVLCLMFLFSFFFAWASLFRRRYLALTIDVLGCAGAIIGVHGTLTLSWPQVAISISFEIALIVGLLLFIFLNYAGSVRANDERAWLVLPLYLPDVVLDVATTIAILPQLRRMHRLAREASKTSGQV